MVSKIDDIEHVISVKLDWLTGCDTNSDIIWFSHVICLKNRYDIGDMCEYLRFHAVRNRIERRASYSKSMSD